MHCTSCGKAIASPQDTFCSTCGTKLAQQPIDPSVSDSKLGTQEKSKSNIGWIIFGFFLFLWGYGHFITPSPNATTTAPALAKTPGLNSWAIDESIDSMTSKTTKIGIIQSTNEVQFQFPYNEPQRMSLIVRDKSGTAAMIRIESGQFICSLADDCFIKIRFDEGKAESFRVSKPADHSSTVLFIDNPTRLIQKLKKAKKVRIASTIYKEGNVIFEFNYDHFEWK